MLKHILFSVLIVGSACSKKEGDSNKAPAPKAEPSPAGTTPAAPAAAPTAPTPAAPAASAEMKIDCDKALPKEIREKYLAGAKIESIPGAFPYAAICKINYGEIDVTCHHNMTLGKQATLEALAKQYPAMKPIDGAPDSLAHTVKAGYQFTAYDQDSECKISGVLDKAIKVDGAAFVKDWLAALPPK